MTAEGIVKRLEALRDHLLRLDTGSGEAALLTEAIKHIEAAEKNARTPGTREQCPKCLIDDAGSLTPAKVLERRECGACPDDKCPILMQRDNVEPIRAGKKE